MAHFLLSHWGNHWGLARVARSVPCGRQLSVVFIFAYYVDHTILLHYAIVGYHILLHNAWFVAQCRNNWTVDKPNIG